MHIVARKYGNLLDFSPDGVAPLPIAIVDLIAPELTYTYKKILRGADAYDPVTGDRRHIRLETRYLFRLEQGRLTTGAGFLPRIVRLLHGAGHQTHLVDVTPPHPRPDRYTVNWANAARYIQFKERQDVCLQRVIDQPCGIVKAPTGFGKTFLEAAVALAFPKAKIHIVCKVVDVVEKTVRRLTAFLPGVGQVGGGKRTFGRVTVFTADSLHLSDGDCDILLADEAHQLMADSYADQLGDKYMWSRNYALTANPEGRLDGADARMECLFGPIIFNMSYTEAVALGLVVPIRVRWLPIRLSENPAAGKTGVPKLRWGIWRNVGRNAMLAAEARTYAAHEQTLMMVATVEHAVHLWQHLPEFELCYGSLKPLDFQSYVKQNLLPQNFVHMHSERRLAMQLAFETGQLKKVISTDVWATGVDMPQLGTIFRGDARDSEILDTQLPGRTSRTFEGKEYGELVDCADFFDKGLQAKSRSRYRSYKELGWEQDWPEGRRQINRDQSMPTRTQTQRRLEIEP